LRLSPAITAKKLKALISPLLILNTAGNSTMM
jgi:hypothetical protein